MVPTIQKLDLSKSRHFCIDFNWGFSKMADICLISNGWDSGLQIQTICNPTSFDHLKSRLVQIHLKYGLLSLDLNCF